MLFKFLKCIKLCEVASPKIATIASVDFCAAAGQVECINSVCFSVQTEINVFALVL